MTTDFYVKDNILLIHLLKFVGYPTFINNKIKGHYPWSKPDLKLIKKAMNAVVL